MYRVVKSIWGKSAKCKYILVWNCCTKITTEWYYGTETERWSWREHNCHRWWQLNVHLPFEITYMSWCSMDTDQKYIWLRSQAIASYCNSHSVVLESHLPQIWAWAWSWLPDKSTVNPMQLEKNLNRSEMWSVGLSKINNTCEYILSICH